MLLGKRTLLTVLSCLDSFPPNSSSFHLLSCSPLISYRKSTPLRWTLLVVFPLEGDGLCSSKVLALHSIG